ncbi:MAG: type IV pilin [Halovenus sp.]
MKARSRAVSPVISTVLLVAVVVILSATISTFTLLFTEEIEEPAPVVSQSSGEFVGGTDNGDQIVRITHLAGESITVSEMEIVVDAPQCEPDTARIVDLPLETLYNGYTDHVEYGSDLVDTSPSGFQNETDFGVIDQKTENTFDAGSYFEFRINAGECRNGSGFDDGETVTVSIVHTPTNAVVIEEVLTAN